ncbi:MAG: M15 family metallopeptidase, partial [Deltaproteobacteria bacterium]|nr:M15 family metallopeptidase [Deltaproteobacteria bacterium]
MKKETHIIIDNNYSFAQALAGTDAPLDIIDRLSMLDVIYYSFDGNKHQGQIIINNELENDLEIIFALMEELKFPLGKAIPIAAYSWRDHNSMADNNTSAFNYRSKSISSAPSKHAMGVAIDINPLFNPMVRREGGTTMIEPPAGRYDK